MRSFTTKRILTAAMFTVVGLASINTGAYAAVTMALCLTDAPGNIGGNCSGSTYDFVSIKTDGTNAGTTITTNGVTAILGTQVTVGSGVVSFNGAVGAWSVNVTTGTVGGLSVQDLNSIDKTSTNGATLDVYWETNQFTSGAPFTELYSGTNILGNGSSGSWASCIENTTALFGFFCGGAGTSTIASGTFGAGAFSGSQSLANSNSVSPFGIFQSLNLVAGNNLNGTTQGTFSGDFGITAAPEPTSILLFGGALVLAGGAIRRRLQS